MSDSTQSEAQTHRSDEPSLGLSLWSLPVLAVGVVSGYFWGFGMPISWMLIGVVVAANVWINRSVIHG